MADQVNRVAVAIAADRTRFDPMSDQEVADALNAKTATRTRTDMTADELYELVDKAEFDGLAAAVKQDLRDLLRLQTIDLSVGSRANAVLKGAFPAGSTTRAAILAALLETTSEAAANGISGEVGRGWVINARRLLGIYTSKDQSSLTTIGRV